MLQLIFSSKVYRITKSTLRRWNHQRIDGSKKWGLRFLVGLLQSTGLRFLRNQWEKRMMHVGWAETYDSVVVRLDGKLGDTVVASGALKALAHEAQRRGKKCLVIGPSLLQEGFIDLEGLELFIYEGKSIYRAWQLLWSLRNQRARLFFNTSYQLKPIHVVLAFGLFADEKWTLKLQNPSGQNLMKQDGATDLNQDPMWRRYQIQLAHWLGKHVEYRYVLGPRFYSRLNSSNLASHRSSKRILINLHGATEARSFSPQALNFLLEKWQSESHSSHRAHFALLLDPKRRSPALAELSSLIKSKAFPIEVAPMAELCQVMEWAQTFDILISPDTGWVHVGCALGLEVHGYYLDDQDSLEKNSQIWAPYGSYFVQYRLGFEQHNRSSMDRRITAQQVETAVIIAQNQKK